MPSRAAVQRSAYLALISAALLLLLLGRGDNEALSRFRIAVTDLLAPVMATLGQPMDSVNELVRAGQQLWYANRDNTRLREDVDRLMHWQAIARKLEQENAALRAQLNLRAEPQASFITARTVADSGGVFVRSLIVNAGRRDGVLRGQAATAAGGLVGRVTEVGERASRLLLLSDLNSRVPVVVEGSRLRGILAGDNTDLPRLIHLPALAEVRPGERIVTSGHGGVFPPGLPVGVVVGTGRGEVRVRPFVDWDRLEYTTLLRYELPRLVPSGNGAGL